MKRFVLLSAVLILVASPVLAETVSRIAAIINQDVITTAQLDREIDKRVSPEVMESDISPAQRDELRRKVLDQVIEDTLLRQRIEKLGLSISDEDIEQAINDVQSQNNINREQLKEALVAQGLTFEEYRERLREQLLQFKLVGREIQSKIEITNSEMRDYYRAHLDDYRSAPYIRLSRITFRLTADSSAAVMRSKAETALNQLRQGKEFFEVLMQNASTAGVDGGDMGQITEGTLSDSFNRAIHELSPGQTSGIIETAEGFHILRLDERNLGETQTFEIVKDQIKNKMLEEKRAAALAEWTKNLRESADIEILL